MPAATADDLVGIPLFDTLEPDERAAIAPWFEFEDVSPGVKLTGEGASGYSFFVLRDGTATVTIDDNEVRTLGPGDFFGELALLGDGRRTATVTTASPSRVLVLFGTEFRQLQQEHPELAARIESGVREIAHAA
ncbi:MAG TPA: cyclic nucleotide-binding domain-containing protein [Gaiellaceae bacterium]|nr:cyclic nucleotide-binding domain-containing protein [Gaiellaceae bacterium]